MVMAISSLAVKVGRMTQSMEHSETEIAQLEARLKDETVRAREKFAKLFTRTEKHESLIAGLDNTVESLSATCTRIENKLDKLIEREMNA